MYTVFYKDFPFPPFITTPKLVHFSGIQLYTPIRLGPVRIHLDGFEQKQVKCQSKFNAVMGMNTKDISKCCH